jgi:SAM-dependent methyltransferase
MTASPSDIAATDGRPEPQAGERIASVRAQYEALPYPPRDPAEEATRLVVGSPSHVLEIDHYLFAGRRDWRQPFRALIAGGGTGDSAIMLAQQLAERGCPAEIHYLDLSTASRAVCEARAAARDLRSLRFHTGSLLDVAGMGLGVFDYIDCVGVLHHLPDPPAGLRALASVLTPEGGMGLMLYGEYGRSGVYPLQEMLRTLAPASMPMPERIALARRLIRFLPQTNLFRRNPFVGDHVNAGDSGLVDLLLHPVDRAYTVPQLVELTRGAGLRIAGFIEPMRYDPATYLADPHLAKMTPHWPFLERAAFAERLASNLRTHVFYVTRAGVDTVARPEEDTDAIPVLRDMDGALWGAQITPGTPMVANLDGYPWRATLPPLAGPIVSLVDGRRSVAEIYSAMGAKGALPMWDDFRRQFEQLYVTLNGANKMLLRYRSR